MQKIEVVGAAIIENNKLLAAQRSSTMSMPLKWEFVGGKVERNETHQEALVREVFEELGIKIKVNDYIATGYSILKDKEIILHVYQAEILEGNPEVREHRALRWVGFEELVELDWPQADIPVVQELMRMYGEQK